MNGQMKKGRSMKNETSMNKRNKNNGGQPKSKRIHFEFASPTAESWLRIAGVAGAAFVAVEIEKWTRFGGRRGEHAIPE